MDAAHTGRNGTPRGGDRRGQRERTLTGQRTDDKAADEGTADHGCGDEQALGDAACLCDEGGFREHGARLILGRISFSRDCGMTVEQTLIRMLILLATVGYARRDDVIDPPMPLLRVGACTARSLGPNLDVPSHDLLQSEVPSSSACAAACCNNSLCAGALFEPASAVTYGGCQRGQPCCFLKTSTLGWRNMSKPMPGSELWTIPGRSQDDEKLTFLSATLGSHMVLQRAPSRSVVWGFTGPNATVTTIMAPMDRRACFTHWGHVGAGRPCDLHTFETVAVADGTWRQSLPPMAASKIAYSFRFSSSNSSTETASMDDVLFGDVFICGGQSNMEYAMPAITNKSREQQLANDYPTIRFFSVGHRTASSTPLRDLQTVWEPWQVASNTSIMRDYSPGHTFFSTFSAVCWIFGRTLSAQLSATGDVPIGLVSNNWGGTKVEQWSPRESLAACNRSDSSGEMYNAMILPYAVGPMQLTGFAWYQGEANTANDTTAEEYACLFPAMITAWRDAFKAPTSFFGFIQLSTWCALPPASLPQMRQAQMAALALPNVGYATNADHGQGCNIHPPSKQYCGERLARSALALQYGQPVAWRSPTYKSATATVDQNGTRAVAVVALSGVTPAGLYTRRPFNYGDGSLYAPVVDCSGSFPLNATANGSMALQCAWAGLLVGGIGWLNASVSTDLSGSTLILTAQIPPVPPVLGVPAVLGSAYGWGPIPMLSVYDRGTALPVLPWNQTLGQ